VAHTSECECERAYVCLRVRACVMCCLSQLWDVADGRIVSRASPGRAVTLGNCGETSSRLQLCALDPEAAQPPGPGCTNTSCPTANTFNISALSSSASDLSSRSGNAIRGSSDQMLIANAYDGQCMEGMLGKNTVLFVRLNIKNDHFAKTGSGQTQGNNSKQEWQPFSCRPAAL
jgi:hypothetical protein